ncbi:MAG: hypothetical protein V4527_13935 [Pseudomonadota bacterium]
MEAQRLCVSVLDGGGITLDGSVHDWQEHDAVKWAA